MVDSIKPTIKIPEHVAIIIDGNRRWAKERNLSTLEGHYKGYKKTEEVPEWLFARGVKTVSFYIFSTENWQRAQEEVNYLMKLIKEAIESDIIRAKEKGWQLLFSGRLSELPGDLPVLCQQAMDQTKDGRAGVVNFCLNYGGRPEIIDAIKKIIQNNLAEEQIHEGLVKKYLYQPAVTDPDMIVRTSGEQRLSGFLMWQSAYSELMFMKKYWPDFEESDIDKIIEEYNIRERRFGGNNPE
ncbi:MAG: polyprenyl diphosphate synthase [Candidatus Falkowbacteria bacterium]